MDWFRSWHGAPTDAKWLVVARKAGVPTSLVVAIAWALMDRASQATPRGSVAGYDAETLAVFFDTTPEHVDAIIAAMRDKGMLVDDVFATWSKRQPVRERDDNASRQAALRAKRQSQDPNDASAKGRPMSPNVALEKKRLEEKRGDTEEKTEKEKERIAICDREFDEQFWPNYPRKKGKAEAKKKYRSKRSKFDCAVIMAGLEHYKESNTGDFWLNPATFLNKERFTDDPNDVGIAPPSRKNPDTVLAALAATVTPMCDDRRQEGVPSRRDTDPSGGKVIDHDPIEGARDST